MYLPSTPTPTPLSSPSSKKRAFDLSGNDVSTQPPSKQVKLPPKYSASKFKPSLGRVGGKPQKKDMQLTGLEGIEDLTAMKFVPATAATINSEPASTMVAKTPRTPNDALAKRAELASELSKDCLSKLTHPGRGLANITVNLCYRHSLFQALFHLPQFISWLREHHKIEDCVSDAQSDCVSCALRYLSNLYWMKFLETRRVTAQLTKIHQIFEDHGWDPRSQSGHGDPEEQMIWMMNQMSQEIPGERFAYYHAFYQFKLQSEIKCRACSSMSRTDGDFVDFLQVPIKPRARGDRIEGLIENYLDETVSKYKCENCKMQADMRRIQSIVFAPDVLMITLKRFEMNQYGTVDKDIDRVVYGSTLDLTSHRADRDRGVLKYHLKAVISHSGTTDLGHYHCIAMTSLGWVDFDDNHVEKTAEEEALDPAVYQNRRDSKWTPYLLFYQRDSESLP